MKVLEKLSVILTGEKDVEGLIGAILFGVSLPIWWVLLYAIV